MFRCFFYSVLGLQSFSSLSTSFSTSFSTNSFEFRLNCKQRLIFNQGPILISDNTFMSVNAAQFCLCKNPTNCLLSMNNGVRRTVFCKTEKAMALSRFVDD